MNRESDTSPSGNEARPSKVPTVLCIDDDRDFATGLCANLRSAGYLPTLAVSAEVAVAMFFELKPQLTIVDVNLPGVDGLTFCELLCSSPDDVHCPIIFLTGRSDEGTVHRCEELCVYHFVKRADYWDSLQSVIEELVVSA